MEKKYLVIAIIGVVLIVSAIVLLADSDIDFTGIFSPSSEYDTYPCPVLEGLVLDTGNRSQSDWFFSAYTMDGEPLVVIANNQGHGLLDGSGNMWSFVIGTCGRKSGCTVSSNSFVYRSVIWATVNKNGNRVSCSMLPSDFPVRQL
mgnify:CR=1 FL=1